MADMPMTASSYINDQLHGCRFAAADSLLIAANMQP